MSAAITPWFAGRLPAEWLSGEPVVTVDRDEILVIMPIPAPDAEGDETARASAAAGQFD